MNDSKSYQSECQLLGSMFLEPSCIPAAMELVPDKFYFESLENRVFYDLLLDCHTKGIQPDLILLRNEIQRRGLQSQIDMDYLVKIAEAVATASNVLHHAKAVKEYYLERRLADIGQTVRQIQSEPGAAAEKIAAVASDFDEIRQESQPRRDTGGLERLLLDTIDGKRKPIKTPFRMIDELSGWLIPGTVSIFCGSPGASKSFVLLQILSGLLDAGIPAAVLELEESNEYHCQRLLAQRSGLAGITNPLWVQTNAGTAMTAYNQSCAFLRQAEKAITTPDGQMTFAQIADWLRGKARQGARFIGIDPITAAQTTRRDAWAEHNDFLQSVKQISVEYGCVVLLITHPTKTVCLLDLNQLAGSAAFGRFCQAAIWLEHTAGASSKVRMSCGTDDAAHNRTLHILKTRNASGQGLQIAAEFSSASLTLHEIGIIVKDKKNEHN